MGEAPVRQVSRAAQPTGSASTTMRPVTPQLALWFRLVPAYAAGYFLSYGLRSVNAVIAPDLMRELLLSTSALGLLTSAYFFGFGLFQLPLGLLLDRFGPRRVEAVLLLVAAVGCAGFAMAHSLGALALARALIGLGVSACLMASFKAFTQWFAAERLPSLTASIMVAGGLGALSSSVPVAAALPWLGWRGVFWVCAALLVLTAAYVWTVPDRSAGAAASPLRQQLRELAGIYTDRVFWRFAPQGCALAGGFMAFQGLWAVPWLMEVNGLERADAAQVLFVLGVAMLCGFVLVATCSLWLAHRGVSPMHLLVAGAGIAVLAELAMILQLAPIWLLWPLLGLSFSLGNVSYSQLAIQFPMAMAGRVNTALNLVIFVGAFALQWGIGAAVDGFVAAGLSRADAFRATFGVLVLAQAMCYAWFCRAPSPRAMAQRRFSGA